MLFVFGTVRSTSLVNELPTLTCVGPLTTIHLNPHSLKRTGSIISCGRNPLNLRRLGTTKGDGGRVILIVTILVVLCHQFGMTQQGHLTRNERLTMLGIRRAKQQDRTTRAGGKRSQVNHTKRIAIVS